jgi:hypothetical protein
MTSADGAHLGPEFEAISMNTPYLDMIRLVMMLDDPAAVLRMSRVIDAFDSQPHVLKAEAAFNEAIERTRQRVSRRERSDSEAANRARAFGALERARYSRESREFFLRRALNEPHADTTTAAGLSAAGDEVGRIVHTFVDRATTWEAQATDGAGSV